MDNKIRLRFSKTDTLRFIGHLDFLKVFTQTIRRSGLPIAYSQGFNPHQIISFALPLPLGMESVNDYADISLTTDVPHDEIIEKLNSAAPQGLRVLAAYKPTGATAAAATAVADYALTADISEEAIQKILTAENIVIPKKTKSGVKNTDIRPDILDITKTDSGAILRLSAGSAKFLNPLLVVAQLIDSTPCNSQLSRLELYRNGEEGLTSL